MLVCIARLVSDAVSWAFDGVPGIILKVYWILEGIAICMLSLNLYFGLPLQTYAQTFSALEAEMKLEGELREQQEQLSLALAAAQQANRASMILF